MAFFKFSIGFSSGYVVVEAATAEEAKRLWSGNSNGDMLLTHYIEGKRTFVCAPMTGEPEDVTKDYVKCDVCMDTKQIYGGLENPGKIRCPHCHWESHPDDVDTAEFSNYQE